MANRIELDMDEVKSLYQKYLSATKVAREMNVSQRTINRRLNKLGLITRNRLKVDAEKIEKLYKKLGSTFKVADKLNISQTTVLNRLKETGVDTSFGKGKNANAWKDGRYKDSEGYIRIHKPEHPKSDKDGYVKEHRLIAEDKIGRKLKENEVAHHVNRKRDDNRPENIKVMTRSKHIKLHKKEVKRNKEGKFVKN